MNQNQRLKAFKHKKQAEKNKERMQKHHDHLEDMRHNGETTLIPMALFDSPRDVVGIASMFTMEGLFDTDQTKAVSRFMLQEFEGEKEVLFAGFVDNIREITDGHGRKHYTLLLQQPQVFGSRFHSVPCRMIDSHIWISLDDITPETSATISYGDYLMFLGEVSSYRGYVEGGYRGWKHGITNINFLKSGYLPISKRYRGRSLMKLIIDDYPRPHVLVKVTDGHIVKVNDLPKWAHDQHERRKTHAPLTEEILKQQYGLISQNGSIVVDPN